MLYTLNIYNIYFLIILNKAEEQKKNTEVII